MGGEAYSVGAWGGGGGEVGGGGTEEMSPGHHCENVTATLTAGQFSKSDAAGRFPLCGRDKEQRGVEGGGGGRGVGEGGRAGTRLCTKRDVSIK